MIDIETTTLLGFFALLAWVAWLGSRQGKKMNTHDIELPRATHFLWDNQHKGTPVGKEQEVRNVIEADRKQRWLKERAQLDAEWVSLRQMKEAYEAVRNRRGEPTAAEISDVIREITGCMDIKNGEDSLVVALGMLFHRCATTQSSEPVKKEILSAARDAGYSFAKGADGVIRMVPLIKGEAHTYDPKKPTEQEWKRLTENGRKAWGDKPAKPVVVDHGEAEPVKVPSMIDLISDDAYAATFQSVGQYRKALLARYGQPTEWQDFPK